MTFVGFTAVLFCSVGALVLSFYNEKVVMSAIEKAKNKSGD